MLALSATQPSHDLAPSWRTAPRATMSHFGSPMKRDSMLSVNMGSDDTELSRFGSLRQRDSALQSVQSSADAEGSTYSIGASVGLHEEPPRIGLETSKRHESMTEGALTPPPTHTHTPPPSLPSCVPIHPPLSLFQFSPVFSFVLRCLFLSRAS